jgi:predicted transposase/invertase (TIGR01784 family)
VPQFDGQRYRLFWAWFEQISSWALPEALRRELLEIKKNAKPEEEKAMISNMGRNLQRYYDEAILKGKQEGIKEGTKKGIKEGIEEGKYKGILEGKRETAKNFLLMGMDVETVAKGTALPVSQIMELQKSLAD